MVMDTDELFLVEAFQSCCQYYFKTRFQQNKFLYFDKIPHSYLGTDYKVEITKISFSWNDKPKITYAMHNIQDPNYGKNKCEFKQSCLVSYFFKVNGLLEIGRETKTINFYANSFSPYGETMSPTIIVDELVVLDDYRKIKQNLKKQFEIENIDEMKYPNSVTGFGYFADILRKGRNIVSKNREISHAYFYYEIAHCHGEIETCLLTALMHQKYSSDFLGRKISFEGKDMYLPNISYSDMQYLAMIGFGFERLYSFWDRIAYLLYNYEPLDFKKAKDISFDKYFRRIESYLQSGKPIAFNTNSIHLKWLRNYHCVDFSKITDYRHRIVHYSMTPMWDGILSSKFISNAYQYTSDPIKLNEVKLEFEGLGNLLCVQFNFCKAGFIRTLELIDELA